jgi:ABC-type Fe3+ transport system substrate-binding protein
MKKSENNIPVLLEKPRKNDLETPEKLKEARPLVQNIKGYKYDIGLTSNGFDLLKNPTQSKHQRHKCIKPFIISLWPTAFQSAFNKVFSKAFPQYTGNDKGSVILNGSVNYDNVFYKHLESLTSAEQLPDILITSDFNSLYHRSCKDNLLNNANFETLNVPIHSIYSNTNIEHPSKLLGMLASDVLVMVVDKLKFGNKQLPREWYELLDPALCNSVALCGDKDFFCNTVFYHYVKSYGLEGVKLLINNALTRIHPEEMVHSINSGNDIGASVYVMPYSYARNIQNKFEYQTIWPDDGAMIIPIQMLAKKGVCEKHNEVISFLTGESLGAELEKHGFLATNPNTCKDYPGSELNWIGWDFIENSDLYKMKTKIRKLLSNKGHIVFD